MEEEGLLCALKVCSVFSLSFVVVRLREEERRLVSC